MTNSKVEFAYQWESVLTDINKEYFFPEKITPFMRSNYRHPAIYRWNIFKKEPEDERLIYIGNTQELCPDRINGYIKPGPSQQTNKRINEELQGYIKIGFKIKLEFLLFDNIKIEDFNLTQSNLQDKYVRLFIEALMIIIYKEKGFKMLNL